MNRIPINVNKKIKAITIGTKKELRDLYGEWIDTSLEIVNPRTKIVATEYVDGQIVFSM